MVAIEVDLREDGVSHCGCAGRCATSDRNYRSASTMARSLVVDHTLVNLPADDRIKATLSAAESRGRDRSRLRPDGAAETPLESSRQLRGAIRVCVEKTKMGARSGAHWCR